MRFDLFDQFSVAQVFPAGATTVSTNSKKKPAAQDLGIGKRQMGLAIFATANAAGANPITVELIQATDAALTTGIDVLASMTFTAAELAAGKAYFLALPPYKMSKAYYGARVTTGAATTATLDIYFGSEDDVAQYKSFDTPYNVENT